MFPEIHCLRCTSSYCRADFRTRELAVYLGSRVGFSSRRNLNGTFVRVRSERESGWMTGIKSISLSCVLLATAAFAQTSQQPGKQSGAPPAGQAPAGQAVDKAASYYHYALGHMYAE